MTKLTTKYDRVIMKAVSADDKFAGQIIIPDLNKEQANVYEVIAVGRGTYNPSYDKWIPTEYQPGDVVYVHSVLVKIVKLNGEEYHVTRDNEILGKIEEDENIN